MNNRKKILFAGGGTAGPVTPLLAVMDACTDAEFHWVGTPDGPERALLAARHVPFTALRAAKFDRFFSLRNVAAPFVFAWSCAQALRLLRRVRPDVVVAAGAFVAVPVVVMARLLRIPSLIHQLDVRPGLANKLMAPFASSVTVTFESSLSDFAKSNVSWTGAPVREAILRPNTDSIPVQPGKPVVLVFGGGTGAQAINDLVARSLDELLPQVQVIHLTGKGKGQGKAEAKRAGYFPYEFLSAEMGEAYKKANVVVTRAGLGTMLELAALLKPAIVIPIPGSHQEDNADVLKRAGAAVVLDQRRVSPQEFAATVVGLATDKTKQAELGTKISHFYRPDAAMKIVEKIREIAYSEASGKQP